VHLDLVDRRDDAGLLDDPGQVGRLEDRRNRHIWTNPIGAESFLR
jgi:hypothetical protein